MLYRPCPDCGANLDPGETCSCKKEEAAPLSRKRPLIQKSTIIISAVAQAVKKTGRSRVYAI